jgi:hypothetical protein
MVVVLGVLSRQNEYMLDACLLDLVGVVSSGRLRRQTPLGTSCLKIARSDEIRSCAPMFFRSFGFRRERHKALLSVTIMEHIVLW